MTTHAPGRPPLMDLPALAERLGVNHRYVRRLSPSDACRS
jgi:hypothetical protein